MSRDRLANYAMTPEKAADIVSHVVANRLRWGKQYDGSDILRSDLLDALVVIAQNGNNAEGELREELTRLRRQLAAANAREAKLKKAAGGDDEDEKE